VQDAENPLRNLPAGAETFSRCPARLARCRVRSARRCGTRCEILSKNCASRWSRLAAWCADAQAIVAACGEKLAIRRQAAACADVNATGIILHTNLGRALWALAPEAIAAVAEVAAGYCESGIRPRNWPARVSDRRRSNRCFAS